MSMSRREMREHVCIMLFQKEFYEKEEMPEQMELYLEDVKGTTPEVRKALEERTELVMEKVKDINDRIDEVSVGWKTNRIGKVELAIMQMAVYEMLYDENVPESVAINEAVELAKKYCGDQTSGFVNAVLGKLTA